ncbi:MAG: bifunctional nicotinamidase/pyrazinamidase [Candidatus Odinarchaeota archaeon]
MVNFYGVELKTERNIVLNKHDALLVIDMQNDFLPGGSMPVEGGDSIIKDINDVIEIFVDSIVVHSQDWHPPNHLSFASNHPNKNPGDEFTSKDGAIGPILWPDHCVENTYGARFHKKINTKMINKIIQKGMNPKIDSYSAFLENDKKTETGLREYLNSFNVKRIFICGLALDYCCYNTAMDGAEFNFETFFMIDLTKGIDDPPSNIMNSLKKMNKNGIKFATKNSLKRW